MVGLIFVGWEGPNGCFKYGGVGRYVVNFLRYARGFFDRVVNVCLGPSEEGVVVRLGGEFCGADVVEVHAPKLTDSTDVSIASVAGFKGLTEFFGRDTFEGYAVITNDFHLCPLGCMLRGLGAFPHIHFMHSISHSPAEHYCVESADALVVASDLMREEVIDWWAYHYSHLDPPPKLPPIHVVPIPPPELPKPSEDPMKYRESILRRTGGEYLLLYVGRVDPYKNVGALKEVLEGVRSVGIKASLLIITPDHIEPFSKYVVVRERVSDGELVTAYRASDLLIHPAKHEPYGLVVLEAITNGLLPITTERVGVAQYLPIPKAKDTKELTKEAIHYLRNPQERKETLKKAENTINKLTWEKHIAILKNIINSLNPP